MKCSTVSFVGIHDSELEFINFYPNPVKDILQIFVPGTLNDVKYQITDITGKITIEGILVPGTDYINVSGFSNGVYFIRFHRINDMGNEIRTDRFVKM
jgi:hypothetical protein